jgi:hypothetical protein
LAFGSTTGAEEAPDVADSFSALARPSTACFAAFSLSLKLSVGVCVGVASLPVCPYAELPG